MKIRLLFLFIAVLTIYSVKSQAVLSQNDMETTLEDTGVITIDVLDNDAGGSSSCMGNLTITILDNAANGSGQVVNGNIEYTPASNFFGNDTIEYQACDCFIGSTNCDQAFLYITVDPVNDAPTAVNDSSTTQEDNSVVIEVLSNDSDIEGGSLSVITTGVAPVNGNAAILGNGDILYVPNPNYFGVDSFPYQVCDDGLGSPTSLCDTAWVYITINPVNDIPTTTQMDTTVSIIEGETICISIANFIDPIDGDLDTMSYSVFSSTDMAVTVLNPMTGELCFIGSTSPIDEVVIEICDQGGLCTTFTVNYVTTLTNDAPTAVNDTVNTQEDVFVEINVLNNDNDPEGETLTVSTVGVTPSNGDVVVEANGNITYTPNPNFFGVDSFQYQICDEGLGVNADILCDIAWVFVTTEFVNDSPVTTSLDTTIIIAEGEVVCFSIADFVISIDGDLDAILYNVLTSTAMANTALDTVTGELCFTGSTIATDEVVVEICDQGGLCTTFTVNYVTTLINDAPTAVDDNYTINEDEASILDVLVNDTDPELQNLTIELICNPSNGEVTLSNNEFIYTPSADFFGMDTFCYRICDEGMPIFCDTAYVYMTINGTLDSIVAVDDIYTVLPNEESTLSVYENDSNPDNDEIDISIINGPSNGTFVVSGDEILYTPDAGFEGYDTLTYQICNTGITCDLATVVILITDNQAAEAVDDVVTVLQDEAITFNPLDNDINPDGDSLSLEILDMSSEGVLTINDDGTLTYEAPLEFIGEEEITYVICDSGIPMFCDTATITFSVEENEFTPQIPNSFSPNGDGQNDFFVIDNLAIYDKASLLIFGRWGDVVFESPTYQNEFDGTANHKSWKNLGEKLVEGIYYYSFSYSTINGDGVKTGYILIKR